MTLRVIKTKMGNDMPFIRSKLNQAIATGILLSSAAVSNSALAQDQQAEADKEVEVIQVTGIRSSIVNAMNVKRGSLKIVDGVSADDIGKLPNDNIAEAIQRIPGVQISRVQGRGSQISVRGLAPRLARTTINGQTFANADFSGFDFGFLESEVASSINVYKSPTADMDEGGLAGVIDIETASPLFIGKEKIVVSASGVYNDLDGETTPRVTATYVNQFLDGDLGVLFNVAAEDVATRFDSIWINADRKIVDTNGDGEANAVMANRARSRIERYDGDSLSFNTAIEYEVNDQTKIGLRGLYAQEEGYFNIANLNPINTTGSNLSYNSVHTATDPNVLDTVFNVSADNVAIVNIPVEREDNASTYAVTADLKWSSDNWYIKGILHTSKGESLFANESFPYRTNLDSLETDLTSSGAGDTDSLGFYSSQAMSNANTWSQNARPDAFHSAKMGAGTSIVRESSESSAQVDFEYMLDDGIMRSVQFGAKYRKQENSRDQVQFSYPGATALMPDFTDVAIVAADNFMGSNRPSNWPKEWLTADTSKIKDIVLTPEVLAGKVVTPYDLENFAADRNIFAAYVMAGFEGEIGDLPFRGNAGVRYVSSDQTSLAPVIDAGENIEYKTSENEVLPSVTLSLDITDDLTSRFSASKVMVRPELIATNFNRAVTRSEDEATGMTTYNVAQGDPNLQSQLATAYDATLEYYYGNGNAVYTSLFYKDVDGATVLQTVCPSDFDLGTGSLSESSGSCMDEAGNSFNIKQVSNSPESNTYLGFEIGLNHNFDNGFGIILNTTYIDADSGIIDEVTGEELPPLGLSKNTYNAIGYYENETYSIRAAYNYRSSYLNSVGGFLGNQQRADRGQLDLSASYSVTDNLDVSFKVLNVLEEPDNDYSGVPVRFQQTGYAGVNYDLGVRFQF